ncbi:MAG: TonB family protein [Bdellovibrionales bacterium]
MSKTNQNTYLYLLTSLAVHLFFCVLLIKSDWFFNSEVNEPAPVSIELISDDNSRLESLRSKTVVAIQKSKKLQNIQSQIKGSPKIEPIKELSTNDTSKRYMGESEIGSGLDVGLSQLSEKEKYLVLLRNKINKIQTYPRQSKIFKEEGLVKIRMTINRNGDLMKLELVESSSFTRLNEAAMKAALEAAPFAKFPEEVDYQNWRIVVPIRFVL